MGTFFEIQCKKAITVPYSCFFTLTGSVKHFVRNRRKAHPAFQMLARLQMVLFNGFSLKLIELGVLSKVEATSLSY